MNTGITSTLAALRVTEAVAAAFATLLVAALGGSRSTRLIIVVAAIARPAILRLVRAFASLAASSDRLLILAFRRSLDLDAGVTRLAARALDFT